MTWLGLDASGSHAGLAVLAADGTVLHKVFAPLRPGLIETLPPLLEQAMLEEAAREHAITNIAVGIGPGSFTGLRTSIALAQGFAAGSGIPLWGVPADAAYAIAFPQLHRPLWVVLRARRNRLFLLRDGIAQACADADIPRPAGAIALAGDEAAATAARLAARGADVLLTNARAIDPVWTVRAAQARAAAGLAPLPALPAYIDPPEAKLPAAGLRPAPR
ncbi:tRNA (adenosine(37)-N6)-threonylcarbamoyltransferase complex dimerization subunit type 1 TsaB [Acidocella sp.]|uniref:tRNA (adenosine(37)-N6)-threonylcarbamoyltransferase complex dimerization subunit type 1 TsaB n=1 Tax=Acidocella sp. TaxID=50710 RepID=UPI00262DB974|nr:tRNA (adenosine(37)-N6)-threonylcarbamoyltransferase complex dimerization subunit type 1 TsaB [Acidocella sp.]